jgi:hypothetical protein
VIGSDARPEVEILTDIKFLSMPVRPEHNRASHTGGILDPLLEESPRGDLFW